jgi:hypothetical protein
MTSATKDRKFCDPGTKGRFQKVRAADPEVRLRSYAASAGQPSRWLAHPSRWLAQPKLTLRRSLA